MNDKKIKQPYYCWGESFSGLDRGSNQLQHSDRQSLMQNSPEKAKRRQEAAEETSKASRA